MKKGLLCILLCLCLTLILIPANLVQAEDPTEEPVEEFGTKEEVFDALGIDADEEELEAELEDAIGPYGEGTMTISAVPELYLKYDLAYSSGSWRVGKETGFSTLTAAEQVKGGSTDSDYNKRYVISEELSLLQDGKVNFVAELKLSAIPNNNNDPSQEPYAINRHPDAEMTLSLFYFTEDGVRNRLDCADDEDDQLKIRLSVVDENKVDDEENTDTRGWENNSWEYDALMEMVAGDFDGDSMDELAVYDPDGACIRFYDIELIDLNEDDVPDRFSLTEMKDAAIRIQQQRYIPQYEGNTENQSKCYQLIYPVVSLTPVDFAQDFKDELAVAVSPNFYRDLEDTGNMTGTGSVLYVYDMNGDLADAPTELYKQQLDWSSEDGYDLYSDEINSMRYVGVAAGDIDGDGGTELIAAGYHVKTGWNDNYGTDSNIMYTILGYDRSKEEVVSEMGGAAGVVCPEGTQISFLADENNEGSDNWHVGSTENSYVPPVAVATVASNGPNAPEAVFMGRYLYTWEPDEDYSNHGVTGMGYNGNAVLKGDMSEEHSIDIGSGWYCCHITDVAVGNFDKDVFGREQLAFTIVHKDGRSVASDGAGPSSELWYYKISYDGSDYNTDVREKYTDVKYVHSASLLALNYDTSDSTFLKPVNRELRYSKAAVLAVLQAAPYFDDLTVLDPINYQSGGTSFGASASMGTSVGVGAEVTASVGLEFEQGFSVFGVNLFKAGATGTVEVASSTEFTASFETSTGVSYETGSQDSVVVFTVPQYVYNYEMWVPESIVPSGSAYNEWIKQRVDMNLASNYGVALPGEGAVEEEDPEIEVIRQELTDEMKADYPAGSEISAHWEPFSVVAPLEMINTVLTVDAYDEVAERCGLQKVRGRLLNNTVGDPSSYTYRPFFFFPGYTGVSIGDSGVSKNFDLSTSADYSLTLTQTISGEGKIGLAGFNVVLGSSISGSVSAGVSVSAGTSYSGTVLNMPEGSDNYGFSWTFGYQPYMLNGLPVPVLQYHVTNVQEPPSLPVDIHVEDSTDSSITLSWEQGRKLAKTYDIYLYDEVYDRTYHIATVSGDSTSYTHTGLSPSTTYRYRMAAVNDATNTSILSAVVTGRTTPSGADAPSFITQPQDINAYPGQQVRFTVQASSNSAGLISYQWQRRIGGSWQNINGARGETYTVIASQENKGANYRCCIYQFISGGTAEAFSNSAVLSVAKMTPTVEITNIDNDNDSIVELSAAAFSLQATVSGSAEKPVPTGNVTYEVVSLSGGVDETLAAVLGDGSYKASWNPTQPGLYRVTAAYSGDARYRSATDSFEVYLKKEGSPLLTLVADNMTYGQSQTFAAKLDGEDVDANYSIIGETVSDADEFTPSKIGTYTVRADYDTYTTQATFNVYPATLTVTAHDAESTVGYPAASVSYKYEGLKGTDTILSTDFSVAAVESYDDDGIATLVSDTTPVGNYPIVVTATEETTDALANRYAIVLQNGDYTVSPLIYSGTLTYSKVGDGEITATAADDSTIESTTPVTFTATPEPGNRVASWSVKVGTANPVITEGDVRTFTYTLTENNDVEVIVTFVEDYYHVSFSADPSEASISATVGSTTISNNAEVAGGTAVTFTATETDNLVFQGWKRGNSTTYSSTHNVYTYTVTADTEMTAEFVDTSDMALYSVTTSAVGKGSVSPAGSQEVRAGYGLSISAEPSNNNNVFVGWTVDGLGDDAEYDITANPLVISNVTDDGEVEANFNAKVKYKVEYDEYDEDDEESDGTVSGATANGTSFASGERLDAGTKLVFTAKIPEDMYVESWIVNGETKSGQNGKTLTLLLAERIETVEVTFTDVPPEEGGGAAAPKAGNTVIIVDGEEYDIGTEDETDDGVSVTADQEELSEYIDDASTESSVVFPIAENDSVSAILVVENIEQMAQKGMTLSVHNGDMSYDIPAVAINTQALMAALNATDPAKVPFTVTITELTDHSVSLQNGMLLLEPVSFSVTATYGGRTVEVKVFEKYVQRVIEIPDSLNASLVTTAVVLENGQQRHVPTEVFQRNGKWYARINSLTNSIYALINYEANFIDDDGKWYEAVVSEMASRGVINGRSLGFFDGEANITRAEFAAILVRALGLPENGDASAFGDVSRGSWYYGAVGKAYEYGLVGGRSNGYFDPMANITRQEAMAMIHRAAAISEFNGNFGSVAHFSDASSISAWAMSDAQWNVGSGLIQGNSGGTICGQDNITRSETATIILRLLQKSQLVDVRARA